MFSATRSMFVLGMGLLTLAKAPTASALPLVTAGGKNTQAVYACVDFDATDKATYTVTVPYGRKGRMLLINAHTRGYPLGQECTQSLVMTVGPASPESFGGSVAGMQGGTDTAVGHWWADLDANEAVSPGSYIGVPIPVQIDVARHLGDPCDWTCITLDVQMIKK
jgi:hypothetical protein